MLEGGGIGGLGRKGKVLGPVAAKAEAADVTLPQPVLVTDLVAVGGLCLVEDRGPLAKPLAVGGQPTRLGGVVDGRFPVGNRRRPTIA